MDKTLNKDVSKIPLNNVDKNLKGILTITDSHKIQYDIVNELKEYLTSRSWNLLKKLYDPIFRTSDEQKAKGVAVWLPAEFNVIQKLMLEIERTPHFTNGNEKYNVECEGIFHYIGAVKDIAEFGHRTVHLFL